MSVSSRDGRTSQNSTICETKVDGLCLTNLAKVGGEQPLELLHPPLESPRAEDHLARRARGAQDPALGRPGRRQLQLQSRGPASVGWRGRVRERVQGKIAGQGESPGEHLVPVADGECWPAVQSGEAGCDLRIGRGEGDCRGVHQVPALLGSAANDRAWSPLLDLDQQGASGKRGGPGRANPAVRRQPSLDVARVEARQWTSRSHPGGPRHISSRKTRVARDRDGGDPQRLSLPVSDSDFERERAGEQPHCQPAQTTDSGPQAAESAACPASPLRIFDGQHPASAPLALQMRPRALGPPLRPALERK